VSTAAPPWLGPDAVASVPPAAAVDALAAAFARGVPEVPQRLHLEVPGVPSGGELLVMPAADDGWAVTKVVGLAPGNPDLGLPRVTSVVVLLGPPGLAPVALIDGAALTALRTAAVSALATRLLARADAREVVVLGAGVQAEAHARVHAALLPGARVRVVARRGEAARALADLLVADGIDAVAAGPDAVGSADVICACTTGTSVVLRGVDLRTGVHVNAVGSHRPDLRELDAAAVAACGVVVELRDAALAEKGDLLLAEREGVWHRDAVRADLAELCAGRVVGRRGPDERTLFASVGHASEDLVVAREVLRAATAAGTTGAGTTGAGSGGGDGSREGA
jgi:ornithine cyclodeaminase/alanine dehydrogenase-like protein (mu-crystallin family)